MKILIDEEVLRQALCCIEGWINACGPVPDAGDLEASKALRTALDAAENVELASMNTLNEYTDEQLLLELITRNGHQDAPKRIEFCSVGWLITTVGIGRDHSVSVCFDVDDLDALTKCAYKMGEVCGKSK